MVLQCVVLVQVQGTFFSQAVESCILYDVYSSPQIDYTIHSINFRVIQDVIMLLYSYKFRLDSLIWRVLSWLATASWKT